VRRRGDLAESRPVVTRPDTIVPAIMCSPGTGYGVTVGSAAAFDAVYQSGHVWQFEGGDDADALYPDGAWLGYWNDTSTAVTVVAPDRATVRRLVDSVQAIDGVDPNGCPTDLGGAEASRVSDPLGTVLSVCRYDEQDLLTASRRLVGEEMRPTDEAIATAPVRTEGIDCPPDAGPVPRTVILNGGGYIATVVTDAACRGHNGVFFSGVVREVTDAVRRQVDLTRLP
jgi:hypothetical protein